MWLNAILRRVADLLTNRPKEIRWTLYGTAAGFIGGFLIGGVGIAAMGSATGLPAFILLGGLGALIGNRVGVERHRRRMTQAPPNPHP
jgi:hypothetical protein